MATTKTIPQARIERHLAAIDAAQRIAGEEPTPLARESARRVLAGEATPEQAIAEALSALEAKHGFTR